ncbi:molybdopterin-synthase adenylyltransferase MoeB [Pontibacter locisalis]|uniref:Molybdopterin-synthase adenylyltransferase MoeB n=1 Tax=Pontibacter locisalis TaxID=1719035 RepID=A0ABW5IMN2_9BACT
MERLGQGFLKHMLQPEEIKRYSRHLILPEIGHEGQAKLKQAKVLMVGAGGLGCPVLQYLTAAGVGTIGIVDDDVVDESNLQRQILYWVEDIGRKKATVAAEKLAKQNPFVKFHTYTERLAAANADKLFADYDLIIDGSDNFPTRYLVNDVCLALNKPLVFGSIFKFEGQVSVFNYQGGPTYRCIYPTSTAPKEMPNCSEIGVLGVLPGLIGSYMANEAIKVICQIGSVLSGKLLVLNSLENTTSIFSFERTAAVPDTECDTAPAIACASSTPVRDISYNELKQWLATAESVYLVDVREQHEYEMFNLGGVNIPLSSLPERLHTLKEIKNIVFCCLSGKRSQYAATLLANTQFKGSIYNLKDGVKPFT